MSNVQEVWFAIGIAGLIFWGVFGLITLINWMLTVSDKKQETQDKLNRLDERIDWVSGWQNTLILDVAQLKHKVYKKKEKTTKK